MHELIYRYNYSWLTLSATIFTWTAGLDVWRNCRRNKMTLSLGPGSGMSSFKSSSVSLLKVAPSFICLFRMKRAESCTLPCKWSLRSSTDRLIHWCTGKTCRGHLITLLIENLNDCVDSDCEFYTTAPGPGAQHLYYLRSTSILSMTVEKGKVPVAFPLHAAFRFYGARKTQTER